MIHLVNPENPVKVQSFADVPHEGRKNLTLLEKFTVAQMKRCVIICSKSEKRSRRKRCMPWQMTERLETAAGLLKPL